jgi:hypothetical protein
MSFFAELNASKVSWSFQSDLSSESNVAFFRTSPEEDLLVLHNLTAKQQELAHTPSSAAFPEVFLYFP